MLGFLFTAACSGGGVSGSSGGEADREYAEPHSEALTFSNTRPTSLVELGDSHGCMVSGKTAGTSGGRVYCWGLNGHGQLGTGSTLSSSTPVRAGSLSDVVSLAAGGYTSCAVTAKGDAYCWGLNSNGQLGPSAPSGDQRSPVPALSGVTVTSMSVGLVHTCAVLADNKLRCFGSNSYGQLGNGTTSPSGDATVTIPGGVQKVSLGDYFSCALSGTGRIHCWGDITYGQIGIGISGGTVPAPSLPVGVGSYDPFVDVAAGGSHACGLRASGTVICWAANASGQVGNGTRVQRDSPVTLSSLPPIRALGAGVDHTCAVANNGTVYCWGANSLGQIGHGTTGTDYLSPVEVYSFPPPEPLSLGGAVSVTGGYRHTCAARSDGHVSCWGSNFSGELGNGTTTASDFAMDVVSAEVANASQQIVAGWDTSCAHLAGGGLKCWGYNGFGALGNGTWSDAYTPTSVLSQPFPGWLFPIYDVTSVSEGSVHTCALDVRGSVYCWGDNGYGQLGFGSIGGPTQLAAGSAVGLSSVKRVFSSAAAYHTCAIATDGRSYCWGANATYQLGNGLTSTTGTPQEVTALSGLSPMLYATQFGVGRSHTCAVMANGAVRCWGDNSYGQLGIAPGLPSPVAVTPSSLFSNAVAVVAGDAFNCALSQGGAVACWGDNFLGQLGQGDTSARVGAVAVALADSAVALTAGNSHVCALLADGRAQCWGKNACGQIGNGTDNNCFGAFPQTLPAFVAGSPRFVSIGAGTNHTCGLRVDGAALCWGQASNGQLGVGALPPALQNTPVSVTAFP